MKVGTHAQEDLASILDRKKKELKEAGVSFWGYGGNTCHPLTKVRPFVAEATEIGQRVILCMHSMNSKHGAEQKRAEEYSLDGKTWHKIPKEINVLGSRYALVIDSLEMTEFDLDLASTTVGVGLQRGRAGTDYLKGRVDKACLNVSDAQQRVGPAPQPVHIDLAAELADPYAVLLR